MYIVNYACTTAAGPDVGSLLDALSQGRDTSQPMWAGGRACFIDGQIEKAESHEEIFHRWLKILWSKMNVDFGNDRVALVFASTKGFIEDYVWHSDEQGIRKHDDPYSKISQSFCDSHPEVSWSVVCNI
ncbi:MAG: hypothetical protein H7326_04425, partial [Bdellovibrionaceae bacterium]|nr:hypothetical protein [Pseudobdellovibrionaceae bacterium]